MQPKKLSFSYKCGMLFPGLATYFFLKVSGHTLYKVASKSFFRGKKAPKFRFLGYFSKVKTEECDEKNLGFSDKFGRSIPCSARYFLEVSAHVSLKVATKRYFMGNKIPTFLAFLRIFF